jgi:hypothetical protein
MSLHNPNYFRTFIATGLVVIAATGEYAAEPLGCEPLAPVEYCNVTAGARPWVADEPTGTIRLPDPAAHLTTPIISGGAITSTIRTTQGPQIVSARAYNNSLDVEHIIGAVRPGRSVLRGPSLPPVWIADVDGSKPKA